MFKTSRLLIPIILVATVGSLFWGMGRAAAEYPPAVGSLSAGASDTTPSPGSSVIITCTALDASGNPLANQPCTFTITSQPGGASFDGALSTVANTDATGVATAVLSTGTTPGTIVVSVEAAGMVSQVTLNTGAAQELPPTGGTPAGSNATTRWPLATGAAALSLILVGTLLILRNRRSTA